MWILFVIYLAITGHGNKLTSAVVITFYGSDKNKSHARCTVDILDCNKDLTEYTALKRVKL